MRETVSRDVPLRSSLLERREDIAVRPRGRARRAEAAAVAAPNGVPPVTPSAHGLTLDALAGVIDQLRADGIAGDAPLVAAVAPSPFASEAEQATIVSIMAVVPAAEEPETVEGDES